MKKDDYYLTFDQRLEIERMYNSGARVVDIAAHIGRGVTTVYADLKRGNTGGRNADRRKTYSAEQAQTVFQDAIAQRGASHKSSPIRRTEWR